MTQNDERTSGPQAARELAPLLRERSAEAERNRRLPQDVASRLGAAGLFRLCVPSCYGGAEAPLPELLETLEELAFADSAAAWIAMIGSTTGLLAARLPSGWAEEIYGRNPEVLTVGAVALSGEATPVQGGDVRINGHWNWGSGIHNADWIIGGTVFPTADAPVGRMVFFRRSDIEIDDDWYTAGMRGTGSNSFRVRGVRAPQGRWASLDGPPVVDAPLYRIDIWCLLAVAVAAVPLGIARRALDELVALAVEKVPTGSRRTTAQRGVVQRQVAEAEAALVSSRSWLWQVAADAWQTVVREGELPMAQRAQLRLAATNATWRAATAVDLLYHAGGGPALFESNYLQRALRDVHVITQHLTVSGRTLELLGRYRLGLEIDDRQL
jgi:alkylation response protein AidB-like acyl-CoA dehydrogenase